MRAYTYVKRRHVSDRRSQTKGGGSHVKSRAMSRVCACGRVRSRRRDSAGHTHHVALRPPRPEELMDAAPPPPPPPPTPPPPPHRGSRVQPIPPDGRWALRCHAAAAERAAACVTRGCGAPSAVSMRLPALGAIAVSPAAVNVHVCLSGLCWKSRSCDFAFSRWDGVFTVSHSNRGNVP